MKFSFLILSTLLFLTACSGASDTIEIDTSASDTAEEVEDAGAAEEDGNEEDGSEEDSSEENGDDEEQDENDKSDTAGVDQKNVKLVVKDQKTVGQIVVEEVATSRDGWVSVHRSQEDGGIQLPDSIGEARVDSGNNEEIIVDLWEAPEIDEKLWVLLHIDAGERGKYEFPGEDVAVTKNGETVARSFVVEGEDKEDEDEENEDE